MHLIFREKKIPDLTLRAFAFSHKQIAEMYQRQSLANKGGKKSKIEDDFW
jgi:hypothetical protein